MNDIVRIAAVSLTAAEQVLYSNKCIVRTIILYNTNATEASVSIVIDSILFKISLNANETKIIEVVTVSNQIKASGLGINIHISGVAL